MQLWCLAALFLCAVRSSADPRFDPTTPFRDVLIPQDAAVGSVIYRLRASDPTFDYPLQFSVERDRGVVTVEALNCTRFNSLCQANVVLQKKLETGRFYDFVVRITNPRNVSATLQCSFRATNATTPIADIFPGAPSLVMVSENARRNFEIGTIIARGSSLSGQSVLLELWGSELFSIRQKLINTVDAEATILLLKQLDYETQPLHQLTVLANNAWTEAGKDSRNIASWPLVVAVIDEQDTPPVFTVAPPTTKLDPLLKPGDFILKVHAEDGDREKPRSIRYGIVSEGSPFAPFFNMSETTGELRLARPLEDILAISHAGAPIQLTVVAEEVRTSMTETPAQSSITQVALLPPLPSSKDITFSQNLYTAKIAENSAPGTVLPLTDAVLYVDPVNSASLTLENNNGTFEVSPGAARGRTEFTVRVREPALLDYETRQSVRCKLLARDLASGNQTAVVDLIVLLTDVNDMPPKFTQDNWNAQISENAPAGTRVIQVSANDPDATREGVVHYTALLGNLNSSFNLDALSGVISVAKPQYLDAERTPQIDLLVEATDEDGKGLKSTSPLTIELVDVNDEPPTFERQLYEFVLAKDMRSFTTPAYIKATDNDITAPNNQVHYELSEADEISIDEYSGELNVLNWRRDEMVELKARAWDGGVPRLWGDTVIRIYPPGSHTRTVLFLVKGRNPDRRSTEEMLEAITGGKVAIREVRPYTGLETGITDVTKGEGSNKDKSVVVSTVTYGTDSVVDITRLNTIFGDRTSEPVKAESNLWWILLLLVLLIIIAIIILLLCCICEQCPLYMPPQKRRVHVAEEDQVKFVVHGEGMGNETKESKGTQVAEWFGRKEAWSAARGETLLMQEADGDVDSLRRHELERGSDRGGRRLLHRQQATREEPRDQLYIREGNTDILRLITRGGEQQRPFALVPEPHYVMVDGKDILMQRFIEQQHERLQQQQVLPNEVSRSQLDLQQHHDLLESSLRQQNELLRQILLERERERERAREDARLETQSLPAGTQTDRDMFTQTEFEYYKPARRRARSDNDDSLSEDEYLLERRRCRERARRAPRKSGRVVENMKRKIRTPIQEESECTIDSLERREKSSHYSETKASVLRKKKNVENGKSAPRSARLQKDVLLEISGDLEQIVPSSVENAVKQDDEEHERNFSEDSLDDRSHAVENVRKYSTQGSSTDRRESSSTSGPVKFHSVNDLSLTGRGNHLEVMTNESKSLSQMDLRNKRKTVPKYMEWYHNLTKSAEGKQKSGASSNAEDAAQPKEQQTKQKTVPKISKRLLADTKSSASKKIVANSSGDKSPSLSMRNLAESSGKQTMSIEHLTQEKVGGPEEATAKVNERVLPGLILKPSAEGVGSDKLLDGLGPQHPLLQHSMHRYERPAFPRRGDEDADSGIALTRPPMAQKKSVFTIAYDDMHTNQLIPEIATPPFN